MAFSSCREKRLLAGRGEGGGGGKHNWSEAKSSEYRVIVVDRQL